MSSGTRRSPWAILRGRLAWPIRRTKVELPELQPASAVTMLAVERRKSERYLCELMATCRIISLANCQPLLAQVRDMSAGGIGLQCSHRLEAGTFLILELNDGNGGKGARLCVKVAYCTRDENSLWRLGCSVIQEGVGPRVDPEAEQRLVLTP